MLDVTCWNCGQRVPGGEPCPFCGSATAIAEGEAPLRRRPRLDDEPMPTIVKEYHYSLLRICLYFLLTWVAFGLCGVAFGFLQFLRRWLTGE